MSTRFDTIKPTTIVFSETALGALKSVSGPAFKVYYYLRWYYYEFRFTEPPRWEEVAEACGMAVRTVQHYYKELRTTGWISDAGAKGGIDLPANRR